jgi:phospholipase C
MAGLSDITNIVVLMFENRSFDNIFGTMHPYGSIWSGYRFEGVTCGTTPTDTGPWTEQLMAWTSELITTPNPDPGEILQDVNMQLFGSTQKGPPWPSTQSLGTPPMNGFVKNYTLKSDASGPLEHEVPRKRRWGPPGYPGKGTYAVGSDIMHCFRFGNLGVSSLLAQLYAVSDMWFASAPTQTYPNRMYAHCGTTWSADVFGHYKEYYDDWDMLDLDSRTNSIFQEIDRQAANNKLPAHAKAPYWKVYYPKKAGSFSISDGLLRYLRGSAQVVDISELASDARAGTLPLYSFIEPPYGMPNPDAGDIPLDASYHPPYDVIQGEYFLGKVYQTLFDPANPAWKTTLLIVVFDEHGGTYDHVPPPEAPLPSAGAYELNGKHIPANPGAAPFDRYGVRVPALLISSQIVPGTLFRGSQPAAGNKPPYLDHTSIIRTVFDWLFGDGVLSLTNRDKNAPTVAGVLTQPPGTNRGLAESGFQNLPQPQPIQWSATDLADLRDADPFRLNREEAERRRRER